MTSQLKQWKFYKAQLITKNQLKTLPIYLISIVLRFEQSCAGNLIMDYFSITLSHHLSVEPGYYEDGAFGLRIENLVLVVKADTKVKLFVMNAFKITSCG